MDAGSRKPSTQQRHQLLQENLLAAAETAIATTGLASLRARSLAETVGCSVGAIYGVFPDLDALVLEVNARTLDALDHAMRTTAVINDPAHNLVCLAETYLTFAASHRQRWSALFQHRMPEGHPLPDWYAARRTAAFSHIEAPLTALRPDLDLAAGKLLARTLFAAVHGMVELGLDEKVVDMTRPVLSAQLRTVVTALARGLASS